MIMSNLHHIRRSHSIMCAQKQRSIKLIACCVHASLHIFTIHYGFPYMGEQNRVSAKNSRSCPFPNDCFVIHIRLLSHRSLVGSVVSVYGSDTKKFVSWIHALAAGLLRWPYK